MNDKSMVSVPRDIAQRLADFCYLIGIPVDSPVIKDLRETLAAPAEDVRAVVDEPVAWRWEWKQAREHDGWCYVHQHPDSKVVHLMDIEPLYRHPQRQFVMPERKGSHNAHHYDWNACLDEFKRLNP